MEWSRFLDSEVISAEINDTSYEPPSCFSLGKKLKSIFFFSKKKFKMADKKKVILQLRQFSIFIGWSLGFWAYVGQSHDHIGWAYSV
jgi:hypothetical protein